MKEAWREYWTAKRNRIIFFAFAGLCLILFAFHSFESLATREAPSVRLTPVDMESGLASSETLESVRQVSSGTAKPIRDPFALPEVLRAFVQQDRNSQQNEAREEFKNLQKKTEESPVLSAPPRETVQVKLTGIVSAAEQKFAILTFGTEHKQCEVNECIGPYRVAEIRSESVILTGQSGTFALTVGR